MAVALAKTNDEIQQLPLVELAWEILKAKKEPFYFRDLMNEIQQLRGMTDDQVMDVIARLYTEINIDGRFICIGQNIWGLKRWYPVDKMAEKSLSSKRFVRRSGDAFSDDDEDIDIDLEEEFEEEEELIVDEEGDEQVALFANDDDEEEAEEVEAETEDDLVVEEEDSLYGDEEGLVEEEPLLDEETDEDNEEEEEQ